MNTARESLAKPRSPRENDGHPADEEQLLVKSDEELCPKGSVPLHRLCDRCRRMFDRFTDVYAWFDGAKSRIRIVFKSLELGSCTLAELAKNRKSCHFCEILSSRLEEYDDLPPYCSVAFRLPENGATYATSTLNLNVWVIDDSRAHFDICITSFTRSSDNIFGAPFVAQHVPRQPADNLVQIQRWLDACTSKHSMCNNWCSGLGTKGYQPTRVLELSDTGIRLRCDLQAIDDFKYLALSHMWGKDPSNQLRLLSSTLQDFQKAIPLNMLSNIFTEAIRITRYLGFKYLWIDSLCIIQDSKSDWTAEANMMSAVYNNAICTIAFVMPPDVSHDSTQHREDPRASTPCIIREPAQARVGVFAYSLRHSKTPELEQQGWPISSRAWTLQEQILSPRTVFCGDQTMKWECVETFSDELTGDLEDERKARSHHYTQKALLSPRPISEPNEPSPPPNLMERKEILSNWTTLINGYRRRDLTKASDRIMAFAGIARAFQAQHGLIYLAGTWKEHLPRSLLWFIGGRSLANHLPLVSQDSGVESAPTWSFFATPLYSSRSNRHRPLAHSHRLGRFKESILFSATLLHFTWPNTPANQSPPTAYYDFVGLRITLEFITIDVSLPRGYTGFPRSCESLKAQLVSLFGASENPKSVWASVDFEKDDDEDCDHYPTEVRIALVEERWADRTYYFEALTLEPAAEKDTWKRLGLCKGDFRSRNVYHSLSDVITPVKALPKSSTSKSGRESVMLRLEGAKIENLTLV